MHAFAQEVHSLCTQVIHITCISSLSNGPAQDCCMGHQNTTFTFQFHKLPLSKMGSKSDTTIMKRPKQSAVLLAGFQNCTWHPQTVT